MGLFKQKQIEDDEKEDRALRAAGHVCGYCDATLSREEIGNTLGGKPVCSHCSHQMTQD